MDPDSQHDNCPAVCVDPETRDGYFVGKVVTDPGIIAEVADHVSIGADEAVFRMPASMWPTIADAAADTYEKGLKGPGQATFAEFLADTERSAVHLELRDFYGPEDPAFVTWKETGRHPDDERDERWRELIGSAVARGVRVRRLRVVSEPVTEYVRWEYEITDAVNVAAGEEVRWLPRPENPGLLPASDFWIFDNRALRLHSYDSEGVRIGDEMIRETVVVAEHAAAFERLWDLAIPHGKYHPE
ncbi:DUF6879 family protein [Sinosporangium album]|nr:DUF6879 family protein [Sinosporangium album]